MTPLLHIEGLAVTRGDMPVLHDIALSIVPGETVALVGANGAGKSTLLAAIIGLLPTAHGTIRWLGNDIAAWPAFRRARAGLGYSPEGRRPFGGLSVLDNLLAACRATAGQRRAQLDAQFALFPELALRRGAPAWQLSGGEAQMLSLARALIGQPKLLLLDEPFLGLAPGAAERLSQALQALSGTGMATLVADEAARLAPLSPRYLGLERGRLALVDNSR